MRCGVGLSEVGRAGDLGDAVTPANTATRPGGDRSGPTRAAERAYIRVLVVLDTAVLAVAILIGYVARFGDEQPSGSEIPYVVVAPALLLAWLVSLRAMRCYDDRVIGYGADEYRRVSAASLRLAGGIAIAGYIAEVGVSRGFLAISFAVGTVGLEVTRFASRKRLHRARDRGAGWSRKVLVVGDTAHVLELVYTLRREPYAGYQVVGACIPDALLAPVPQRLGDVPVVGSFRGIPEAATAIGADTVAVTASGELTAARLRRLGWQLEGTGVDLVLAPALTDVAGPRIHTRPVAGLPLIHVEAPEFRGARKLVKGLVDRSLSLVALLSAAAPDRADRARHQAGQPGAGAVPPGPGRSGRQGVRGLQVPHHGGQRGRPAGRAGRTQRDRRPDVQDARRPPGDPGRQAAAQVVPGRASPARQRAAR